MLRHGQLHVQSDDVEQDGTRRAITLKDLPGKGIISYSGYLWPAGSKKRASDIEASDYRDWKVLRFASWELAWAHFAASPEFEDLVPGLRNQVEHLIATGKNKPGPVT